MIKRIFKLKNTRPKKFDKLKIALIGGGTGCRL